MAAYDRRPDLTDEIRKLKSRLADLERMQLASEDAAWQAATLVGGASNHGAGYAPVGWYRDTFGRVYVRGVVDLPALTPDGTVMFTLDEGFRPAYSHSFLCPSVDGSDNAVVLVSTSGAVSLVFAVDTAFNTSLDVIQFRVI